MIHVFTRDRDEMTSQGLNEDQTGIKVLAYASDNFLHQNFDQFWTPCLEVLWPRSAYREAFIVHT